MSTIPQQIQALKNNITSLRAMINGVRDQGKLYAITGDYCVFGCKITQGSSATDMYLALDGQATGDESHLNPDIQSPPLRHEEYANIALIYGEVFELPNINKTDTADASLLLESAPVTANYGRYDLVYAYVGQAGPAIGILTGTASAAVKTDFTANGLDTDSYPSSFDGTLPHGTFPLARVYVQTGDTGIANARIADLRNFKGRMTSYFPIAGGAIEVNSASAALRITQLGSGNALLVEDSGNPDATPFTVTASGKVVVGHTTTIDSYSVAQNAGLQLANVHQVSSSYSADIFGPAFELNKSRNATPGAHTIVQSDDRLGLLWFAGSDGAAFKSGALIRVQVDGVPGLNNMPGRIIFSTTPPGASAPLDRMRIDSAGRVGITDTVNPSTSNFSVNVVPIAGVDSFGVRNISPVNSGVTSTYYAFSAELVTAAQAFVLPNFVNFHAGVLTVGAGSSITNHFGFNVPSTLVSAVNNFGFRSNIPAGTGRWNFYAGGTAQNYFGGDVIQKLAASVTPVNNSELMMQLTSNTQLTIKVKGTDGTVRSVNLTLA